MTRLSLDQLHDSLADAPHALQRRFASTMDDARHALARGGAAGRAAAQAAAHDLSGHARHAGRRARDVLAQRPLEAVAIAAVAGLALGWLVRYLSEPRRAAAGRGARGRADARSAAASTGASAQRRSRTAASD